MKKCFIVPYFGVLPDYFQLFLNSTRENEGFNWLIITNDQSPYNYPSNVTRVIMEFEDCIQLIQSKFPFEVVIKRPHKLCDFKPSYGYVFADYLKNYDYWGYCDLDVIYGDLKKFYPDELIDQYDRIGMYGHFCLMKNIKEINELFMMEYNGKFPYKIAFTADKYLALDEPHSEIGSVNDFILKTNLRFNTEYNCLNFSSVSWSFKETIFIKEKNRYEPKFTSGMVAARENGSILKYEIVNNKITKTAYAYLHLHKRRMEIHIPRESVEFIVVPNEFISYNISISPSFIKEHSRNPVVDKQYFKIRMKNLVTKLKLLFGLRLD